jgi:hypothetical protein
MFCAKLKQGIKTVGLYSREHFLGNNLIYDILKSEKDCKNTPDLRHLDPKKISRPPFTLPPLPIPYKKKNIFNTQTLGSVP